MPATAILEHGVQAAQRAVETASAQVKDAYEDADTDARYAIKHEPVKSVGLAFGAGLAVGFAGTAVAWYATHRKH